MEHAVCFLPLISVKGKHNTYLFAFGSWRVKAVVGKIPSKDVEFTGNNPPRITQFHFMLWWKESLELPGKHDTHGRCRSGPVAKARKSDVRNLERQKHSHKLTLFLCDATYIILTQKKKRLKVSNNNDKVKNNGTIKGANL